MAGTTLGLNAVTDGLLPNAGPLIKGGKACKAIEKAETLNANRRRGAEFEKEIKQLLEKTDKNVVEQVTVKTGSGTKTRIDLVSKDAQTGQIKLIEAKSSATAPLTPNQTKAFPEIGKSRATVVGNGKPGIPPGTKIPPTDVKVTRP